MLDKTYDPKEIEARLLPGMGAGRRLPRASESPKQPYCIVIPPPNVTGSLHMGHALDNTLQDVLIRCRRMKGDDALWQPGTDHAGIATQMVVVRNLEQEGIGLAVEGAATERRQQEAAHPRGVPGQGLGMEGLLRRHHHRPAAPAGRLVRLEPRALHHGRGPVGAPCSRCSSTSTRPGLIYKDNRLVNWDPKMLTAISDLEVEPREVKGHLWYFEYPIEGSDEHIVVATTRPETDAGRHRRGGASRRSQARST